ncbi:5-methylthioadenosine/S-adenosylhomocysteine deaminase [Alkalidesulfovibrio alkalitolerans DSM 16529]|uniref:5-methylthioadenosine/S-adenosylhomocysteine deaminase n=1 Tax=Alkalidesulfovibrio alkalitolerans DSM 16529 TaxID=1121439 RepID=S7T1R9_9BACT|nr:amidohydrolase [Alkalidesulfovibrio alkalitolerans]EPR30460.1 5-methylthioadenosine/S-adenosylhomocysteine deaminase [Alkalidesulfovibrio alkalitolerans DSM 16529]
MDIACDLLVLADVVVTQDDERRVIHDGAVAIHGDTITAVGTRAEIEPLANADRVLDLGAAMLLPGLVNAHSHVAMSLFRGLADDLPLMEWLSDHIWPVEKRLTPRMVHLGALLACAEMIASGTTCFSDMYLLEHEVAAAAEATGMRAVVAEGVITTPTMTYATPEEGYALIERLHRRYDGHPLVSTAVMAHAVYTTSPTMLKDSFALAGRLDAPFMLHAAESAEETRQCVEAFGMRPIAHLESLGLLSPRTTLFHCVDVTMDEIALLAERGTAVVHCPESNMKLGNGFAPVQKMLDAGVRVGLGTDGAASNNDLSMFREMGSAARIQKAYRGDPSVLNEKSVLDMATIGSAHALRLPGLGRIAAGFRADMCALDMSCPNLMPLHDPVSQAVYAATGGEVRLTMVNGRVLYMDGRFLALDHEALVEEARDVAAWVAEGGIC